MKIVLVQRPSSSGFSLEAVYGAIHEELSKKIANKNSRSQTVSSLSDELSGIRLPSSYIS